MKFVIKLIVNAIVAVPLLMWFSNATFIGSLIAVVIFGLVGFWLGDLLVLRYSNNLLATALDAVLAFFYFWFAAYYANWSITFNELIVLTLALGVAEALYHWYLKSDREFAG